MKAALNLDGIFKLGYMIQRERKARGDDQIIFNVTDFPSAEAAARTIGTLTRQNAAWIAEKTSEWSSLKFNPPGGGIREMLRACQPVK